MLPAILSKKKTNHTKDKSLIALERRFSSSQNS